MIDKTGAPLRCAVTAAWCQGRVVITGAGTGIGKDRRVRDGDLLANVGGLCVKELARLLRQHPSISVLLGCQHEIEREEGRMRALDEAHAGKGRSVPVSHLVFTSRYSKPRRFEECCLWSC